MQYNHIFNLKKTNNKPLISRLVKVLIFLFVTVYIFYSIRHKEDFDKDFKEEIRLVFTNYGYWIFIPVFLFPLNWALEAWKWEYLTRKIEKISFLKSFRGIITGVTLGFATPFGLGDYIARILQLRNPDRARGLGAVFISRISQFYITLVCGSASLVFVIYKFKNIDQLFGGVFIFFILIVNIVFIGFLLFHKRLLLIFKKIPLFKKIYPYFDIIEYYSNSEIGKVILISFLRYIVFTVQFILLLYFFNVSDDLSLLLMGVNFIFLVKSVVPTLFDLGVRESSAVYFFSDYVVSTDKVIFASLSIWAINILIPALLGMFLIFRLKIFTKP